MEKDITQLLRDMADELGVRADHLWEVLIKQSFIQGLEYAIIPGVITTLLIPTFIFFFRKWRQDGSSCNAWDMPAFLSGLLLLTCIIVWICCIFSAITCFTNPEYWALNEILEKL